MNKQALPKLKAGEDAPPSFVGYDHEGRFIHFCHCGKWGAYSVGYFPAKGRYGVWYCKEHRPR